MPIVAIGEYDWLLKDDPRQHEGSERATIQRVCRSLLMEVGHAAGSQAHHAMTAIVAYIECFYNRRLSHSKLSFQSQQHSRRTLSALRLLNLPVREIG
jgi:hypothetical protein